MSELNIYLLCVALLAWGALFWYINKAIRTENKTLRAEAIQTELDFCKLEKAHEIVVSQRAETRGKKLTAVTLSGKELEKFVIGGFALYLMYTGCLKAEMLSEVLEVLNKSIEKKPCAGELKNET